MATQTTAIGRFTDDPIERNYGSSNEGKMALFSLAVDTGRDETQFYECIAFGRTAENILKYFVKGRPINVTGIFQNNHQERTTPGGEKYTNYGMTFLVRHFTFLPTDNTQNDSGGQQAAPAQQQQQQQQGFGGQQAAPAQQQGGQQQATPQENPFAGFNTGGFNTTGADDGVPF